jgi:hypothetical protein
MKRIAGMLLALLAGIACIAPHAMAAEPLSMQTGGSLVIDTDGSVRDLTVSKGLTPAIAALVERSVRSWKFEPILRDGQAIVARTGYAMKLVATPVEDGFSVRVEDVSFGSPRMVVEQSMAFAPDLARLGQNVWVLVALRAAKDGKVTDAAVIAVESMDGSQVTRKGQIESIVSRGVKRWQFEPARPELGDPDILDGTMAINVASSRLPMAEWRAPTWTDRKPVPWETNQPLKTDGLAAGQFAAVDARIKLKTDVVGKTL